jgi:hypothetical protein
MTKTPECDEGEEAAKRFRKLTEKVVSVSKGEIDKRSAEDRAKRDRQKTEQAED